MSKKLLAAAVAALSLAACQETKTVTPAPPAPKVASAPKPVEPTPVVAAVEVRDAGAAQAEAAPVDVLALAHDAPGVDHLARAKQLKTEGDVKGALTEARRAIFVSSTDEDALELIGRIGNQAQEPELAIEAWRRLARIRSDDALPMVQVARITYQLKDYAQAVVAGREAVARDPGHVEAHHIVGLSLLAMNELGGAIASFEKVIELNPEHGWALNNLGFAYLRANENENAVEVLIKAAQKLPTVAYVHNNLGVAYERLGQKDEAKSAYQKAMDLSPKYVKAKINAARIAKADVTEPQLETPAGDTELHPQPEAPKPSP